MGALVVVAFSMESSTLGFGLIVLVLSMVSSRFELTVLSNEIGGTFAKDGCSRLVFTVLVIDTGISF